MCLHYFAPVDDQQGPYNSAAHESLRAVGRCMIVSFGPVEARTRLVGALRAMGASCMSDLTEWGANYLRKFLDRQLPIRGDYA